VTARAFKRRQISGVHNKLDGMIIVQVGERFFVLDDVTIKPLRWNFTGVWSRMPDEGNSVWEPV